MKKRQRSWLMVLTLGLCLFCFFSFSFQPQEEKEVRTLLEMRSRVLSAAMDNQLSKKDTLKQLQEIEIEINGTPTKKLEKFSGFSFFLEKSV